MSVGQQAKTGIAFGGELESDYHEEVGLPLHNGIREEQVWNLGIH